MPKRKSLFTRAKKRTSTTPNTRVSASRSSLPQSQLTPTTSRPAPRRQTSQASESDELEKAPSISPQQLAGRKRKRQSSSHQARKTKDKHAEDPDELVAEDDLEPEPSREPSASDSQEDELARIKYPTLQPRQRLIPQATVKNKWEPLTPSAQETILSLFSSVEAPMLSLQKGETKRVEAQLVLSQLLRTLGRRVPRMPFPKGTQEAAFDGEGTLRSNRALEIQLAGASHGVALLKTEIRREKERVEEMADEVTVLRRNMKAEGRNRARRAKVHHLLEREEDESEEEEDEEVMVVVGPSADDIGLVVEGDGDEGDVFEGGLDEELEPLAEQITSHLESVEGNIAQLEGVREQVDLSAAKLDAVLFQKLSKQAYRELPPV